MATLKKLERLQESAHVSPVSKVLPCDFIKMGIHRCNFPRNLPTFLYKMFLKTFLNN